MAESFVQVPPDGAGKQIDTFTSGASGAHRQVTVLGDPNATANVLVIKAGSAPAAPTDTAMPVSVRDLEPNGAAITGATMPSGGAGITGWLSAIWSKLASTLTVSGSVSVS